MSTISEHAVRAHSDAVRLSPQDLVSRLRDLLGARLVAYIGHVGETRAVRQWAEGTRQPASGPLGRLRVAYQVAAMLAETDSATTIQVWFQGLNPHLSDDSPARLLRTGDLDSVGPAVIDAARAFTTTSSS